MDDPFAALVEEMNLNTGEDQKQSPPPNPTVIKTEIKEVNEAPEEPKPPPKEEGPSPTPEQVLKPEKEVEPAPELELELELAPKPKPQPEPPQVILEPEPKPEPEPEPDLEEDDGDEEESFVESINAITSISELRDQFISFYRLKESQMYDLKSKFTDISRRQKEVFIEVENRRKLAVSKGKKYKQTAQKLHYQVNKLNNDLKFERKKNSELSDELSIIRDQKKQREDAIETLTNDITSLRSNLSETAQSKDLILDSYQQTHSVIDKLIQNEKVQEKLKCFIKVEANEAKSNAKEVTNLSVLRLEFLDASIDAKSISIQWNRSYFTELINIKNANATKYKVSADDIGSIIKVEVRSKDNPECYQTAVLKHGAIKMHGQCTKTVEENLLKIAKQQIEFEISPDLSDATTEKLISKATSAAKQSMILLFNKDKIKLRTHKNVTIDKEQYNDSMKMTLSAISSNRFSFKLSSSKKYVFLTKTAMQRDSIAILLRSYIERLRRNTHNVLCELYLRISNERRNYETLNKAKGLGDNALTRDQLVSKILAPISSNPRIAPQSFSFGINSNGIAPGSGSIGRSLAPMTNPAVRNEASFGNEPELDIDAIFPDFNEDNTTEHDKECQMFVEQLISHGYYIQSEKDEMNLKAHNKYKKAWKKLEFVENATIASEQELAQNVMAAPPSSSRGTKRKRKKPKKTKAKCKKKKKKATVAQHQTQITQGAQQKQMAQHQAVRLMQQQLQAQIIQVRQLQPQQQQPQTEGDSFTHQQLQAQQQQRESKPQTPEIHWSGEDEDAIEPNKPRSRPPPRHGSFLSEY
eukprot:1071832_1